MTAVIADTSPLLRKIPSDPGVDARSFGFSPSPMSFARYLEEGLQQQRPRQSPSPRAYMAGQTPSPYPRNYGYAVTESFPYDEPGTLAAPNRIPTPASSQPICSTCRSFQRCTCFTAVTDTPSSGPWNKDRARSGLFLGERSPSPIGKAAFPAGAPGEATSTVIAANRTRAARDGGVAKVLRKKSDWENLLGAVDLELKAQERNSNIPAGSPPKRTKTGDNAAHSSAANINHGTTYRVPLHTTVGGNRHSSTGHGSACGSMEADPKLKHHRRGGAVGDGAAGGGPAYSGSTADAACLLATLPQRMLAGVSAPSRSADADPAAALIASVPSPSLGSVPGPPAPIRVQASGRRGPRGQSRFKGVCITRAGKWRAVIYIGRKQKYLGVFDSEYDAARAYDHAAVQHFAEGAKLNFPGGLKEQLEAAAREPTLSCTHGVGGSGGAAAARAATPPPFESQSGANRAHKRPFDDAYPDEERVCDERPWNGSRR